MFGKLKKYLHNVLVGADQEANIITGGLPDETISSRSERAAQRGNLAGKAMRRFLHLFQKNHGVRAQQGDLKRAQKVEEVEKEYLGDA